MIQQRQGVPSRELGMEALKEAAYLESENFRYLNLTFSIVIQATICTSILIASDHQSGGYM
jgi:hypothetical protein